MKQLFTDIFCKLSGCTDCGQLATCEYLSFAIISMIFGLLSLTVDYIIYRQTEESYLKVKYQGLLGVFLFWTLGSFIVGYIGAAAQIFDTAKIFPALIVGISWQVIFARWAAGKFENDDTQPLNAS